MPDWKVIAGVSGSLLAASAVAAGAFGAHALRAHLDIAEMALWKTAVDYLFWHALGLMLVATVPGDSPHWRKIGSLSFLAGIALFCGSLFALALGAPPQIGILTPLGGCAFLIAWISAAMLFAKTLKE